MARINNYVLQPKILDESTPLHTAIQSFHSGEKIGTKPPILLYDISVSMVELHLRFY